jgi:uncharacterized membrane protein (UPF0127 family)
MVKLIINNSLFDVKCPMTDKDISNGMMGKKFNADFNGMLFLMKEGNHSFWMVDCIVHLDIIFIDNNVITKIHKNCKPCSDKTGVKCERYRGYGDMVLEINGGDCDKYGIKEGMSINHPTKLGI